MNAQPCPEKQRGEGRSGPQVEEIFRAHGPAYLDAHVFPPQVAKVLRAVIACRTSALGGHVWECDTCDYEVPVYDSCCDRHCPICQYPRQLRWVEGRMKRMLPTYHFHVVFTLPAELRALTLANPRVLLPILFQAASSTLQTLGQQHLGGVLGITSVLHTWGGQMQYHPHAHCIVSGGAYDAEGDTWNHADKAYLFPVAVMRALYRGRVLHKLGKARQRGELSFVGGCAHLADPQAWAKMRDALYRKDWVVYAKKPFRDTPRLVKYLGAYTHRVAISNSRIVEIADQTVTIRDKKRRPVRLRIEEFIRRFLLHVLPPGFTKIRHYGLYASANVRKKLPKARALLVGVAGDPERIDVPSVEPPEPPTRSCPCCKTGRLFRSREIPASPKEDGPSSDRRCRGPPPALPPGIH